MNIEGTVVRILPLEQVNDNYSKRKLHLSVEGKYPQTLEFEFGNKAASELEKFAEGEKVKIEFDLRGREWKNQQGELKVFNTLSAWKIESLAKAAATGVAEVDPF